MIRRKFLLGSLGALSLLAAPSVVKATSLDPLPRSSDADLIEMYWRNGWVLPKRTFHVNRTVVLGGRSFGKTTHLVWPKLDIVSSANGDVLRLLSAKDGARVVRCHGMLLQRARGSRVAEKAAVLRGGDAASFRAADAMLAGTNYRGSTILAEHQWWSLGGSGIGIGPTSDYVSAHTA